MYAPVTPNQKLFKLRLFCLEYFSLVLVNLKIWLLILNVRCVPWRIKTLNLTQI